MKQQKSVFGRIMDSADLPGETAPGLPLIELAGDRRVLIENHQGVTEYGCEKIRIRVGYGQVCVCGASLVLARMTREQLVICGRIDSVTLIRGRV